MSLARALAFLALSAACPPPVTVPMLPGTRPVVLAHIDHRDAAMLLDTGAQRTVLDAAAAARLHVRLSDWAAMTVAGVGGAERRPVAELAALDLAGISLARASLAARLSVPVAHLPPGAGIDGLLGTDMLATLLIELDLPARRLVLHACAPALPPDAIILPTEPRQGRQTITVTLDGRPARALIDTGADRGLIARDGPAAPPGPASIQGIGPARPGRSIRDARLAVPGLPPLQTSFLAGVERIGHGIDLVLGTDWLAAHKLIFDPAGSRIILLPSRTPAPVGG